MDKITAKLDQLEDEIERLRTALEFYADKKNWTFRWLEAQAQYVNNDYGKVARKALGIEEKE